MKHRIFIISFICLLLGARAQTGSIDNIRVSQRTGEELRMVDILFDLSGIHAGYTISLEVSFNDGSTFTDIHPGHVTGDLVVAPADDILLVWDGRINHPNHHISSTRIRITATTTCPATITYHGEEYPNVLIGDQCWMAKNLNYDAQGNDWCYNYNPINCTGYGRLYDWHTIMNGESASNLVPSGRRGICPEGWHVPSDNEWKILEGTVDTQFGVGDAEWEKLSEWRGHDAGKRLKSTLGWHGSGAGTDDFGFRAVHSGMNDGAGFFNDLGDKGYFWTSTEINWEASQYRSLSYDSDQIERNIFLKSFAFSLRCVKD